MKKLSQNGKFLDTAPKKGSEIWMERNEGINGTGSVSKSVNKTKVTTRAKTKQAKEQALKIKVIGSSDDYKKDSVKRKCESSSESDYEDESDQTDASKKADLSKVRGKIFKKLKNDPYPQNQIDKTFKTYENAFKQDNVIKNGIRLKNIEEKLTSLNESVSANEPVSSNLTNIPSLDQHQIALLEASTVDNYVYQKQKAKSKSFSSTSNSSNNSQSQPISLAYSSQPQPTLNSTNSSQPQPSIRELSEHAARQFSILRALNTSEQIIYNNQNNQNNETMLPIDQWYKGYERILELKLKHPSHTSFATHLMLEFFSNDQLTDENVTVLGRSANGYHNENLKGLDLFKMTSIRRTLLNHVEGSERVKNEVWVSCTKAMSKKMHSLKREKRITNSIRNNLVRDVNATN